MNRDSINYTQVKATLRKPMYILHEIAVKFRAKSIEADFTKFYLCSRYCVINEKIANRQWYWINIESENKYSIVFTEA